MRDIVVDCDDETYTYTVDGEENPLPPLVVSSGLRKGDVIIAFENKPVKDCADLTKKLKKVKSADIVTLTVLRRGRQCEVVVRVG